MKKYIGAIDQGTTSTRFMLFDHNGDVAGVSQKEHKQYFPKPGWVEHNALEIWENTQAVMLAALKDAGVRPADLAAIGITNQRETTLIWDRETGGPLHHAIVWQDTRTSAVCTELANRHGGVDAFRDRTGLPVSTYFSGPKIRWLLDHSEAVKKAVSKGTAMFGTMDSWLLWNLTGGANGGLHVTDVTNAGRTQLMNIGTLEWDAEMLSIMDVPDTILPEIKPSSMVFAETNASGFLGAAIPIAGMLGDQHAAMMGQTAFQVGEAKNTYGTGCFMLLNTGNEPVLSENGLLTTLAYQLEGQSPVYALEGSVAIAGALVQWLRDNLGLIETSEQVEELAKSVDDNGGVYFVPAFSGLFAPYWKNDARGVIAGLTRFVNKGHIARAVLEATAYQTREILDAMIRDSGADLKTLKVDGGMVKNQLLMQFQADVLKVPVVTPKVSETTALGAAYAAGLAVGFWQDLNDLKKNWQISTTWQPDPKSEAFGAGYQQWLKAVERTFDWVDE